jgi:hypothetical protein
MTERVDARAERRHEITKLILGFVLTTLVGGALTFLYERSQERQRIREQRRIEATKVFESISELMDTRLYKWRQVAWAVEDGKSAEEIWVKYDDYQKTLREWSFSLNRNRALLCRYFGPEVGQTFEGEVIYGFKEVQDSLRERLGTNLRERRTTFSQEALNDIADPLNNAIYRLNNQLAEGIRSGDLGSSDPGNECDIKIKSGGDGR